jgi:type II secretory pathway component PulK
MRRNSSQRRGYVLVLTLGIITLAAISLAGLARYSLGLASSAQDAAEALQRRWGLLSARHVFMDRAAEILDAQVRPNESGTPPWPKPSKVTAAFNLGTQNFTVVIADEDAKANLNVVFAQKGAELSSAIRHLSQDSEGLSLRLQPAKTAASAFKSWGQIFDLANSPQDHGPAKTLVDLSQEITCWGSGRLNLRRASDAAVSEIACTVLSKKDANDLVSRRRNWGGQSVDDLLAQLELRRADQLAASRLFSAEGGSYSMWITIDNGQRTWSYDYVDDGGPVCFAW